MTNRLGRRSIETTKGGGNSKMREDDMVSGRGIIRREGRVGFAKVMQSRQWENPT